MSKKNKPNRILKVDENELIHDFLSIPCEAMEKPIANGVLSNGHNYQIQVKITTNEDEFIEEN